MEHEGVTGAGPGGNNHFTFLNSIIVQATSKHAYISQMGDMTRQVSLDHVTVLALLVKGHHYVDELGLVL